MGYSINLLSDADIAQMSVGAIKEYANHGINGNTRRPRMDGLYSPRIFGLPILSDDAEQISYPGCTIKKVPQEKYSKEIAYYPSPIPYLAFYKLQGFNNFMKNMGLLTFRKIEDVWSYQYLLEELPQANFSDKDMDSLSDDAIVMDDVLEEGPESFVGDDFEDNNDIYINYEVISPDGTHYDLIIRELEDTEDFDRRSIGLFGLDRLKTFKNSKGQSFDWIEKFINYYVPIVSPSMRPWRYQMVGGTERLYIHPLTSYYVGIIRTSKLIASSFDTSFHNMIDQATLCFGVNHLINSVFMSIDLFASSKESLIRNLSETRVGRSGRANIVSAPELTIDEVKLPRGLAYKALEQDIIKGLDAYSNIKDKLTAYKSASPEAIKVFTELVANGKAVLDRNPSLHKYNALAFDIVLWDEPVIGLPNLVCEGFNADFDKLYVA